MTFARYRDYLKQLQQAQLKCTGADGIIFSMSASHSQVRVTVYTQLSPQQTFFLYREAEETEGMKMMQRLNAFLESTAVWNNLNLNKANG